MQPRADRNAKIVSINDASGSIIAPEWLARAELVHRQLRPKLPDDYTKKMRSVFAGGARMCVAAIGDTVVGVAVYRVYENTFDGIHLYVDDLITDEGLRSNGIGKALMEHIQVVARDTACVSVTLDSGTQRQQAHKFYFREGMVVTAFHFEKELILSP